MSSNCIYYESFDENFYNKTYKVTNEKKEKEELFNHWLKYGKNLDYVINKEQLKDRLSLNINYNKELIKITNFKSNNSLEFNILIRTSERHDFFKKCVESILNQKYKGKINIYVSCDTLNTCKYVQNYKNLEYIFINKKNNTYGFNLYCNKLLDMVKDGWIIFLDDDDMFLTDHALEIISNSITHENDLIIWNFLRADKIIKPGVVLKKGELDTTCFCFHSKYKKISNWVPIRCSDYYFFKKLDEKTKFNKKFLNLSLVKTIYENSIASFGLS